MDKTTEIILEIENAERISFEQSFKIVSYCTQLLSQHSAEAELSARKIVIHVLNNWGKIDKNLYVVWADLIETLGFYPYIQKNSSDLKIMSFADDVRMSYFKSDFLKNIKSRLRKTLPLSLKHSRREGLKSFQAEPTIISCWLA